MILNVYSDGASLSNPGPSAIAFTILNPEGKVLKEHSEHIGVGTNNRAEYMALIAALKSGLNLGTKLICYLDSELVVKQLNGEYNINDPKLRNLWRQVIALKEKFRKVSFVHVPRTNVHIKRVDRLANQVLEEVNHTLTDNSTTHKRNQQLQLNFFDHTS